MDNRILFTGIVKHNQDPFVTGQVRIIPKDDEDIVSLLSDYYKKSGLSEKEFYNEDKSDINQNIFYTKNDPFVYQQFSDSAISIQPNVGSLCLLIYTNKSNNSGRKNQFYIPMPKHSIENLVSENANKTEGNLAKGVNYSFRKPLKDVNGQYNNKKTFGCFAEPNDNAFYGKGTTNVILKSNDVLIRAGSCLNLGDGLAPDINTKMGFIQVSNFAGNKIKLPNNVVNNSVPDTTPISKVVEYEITSGLDSQTDEYSGNVKIFNMPNLKDLAQNLFGFITPLPEQVKAPIKEFKFTNLPASGVSEFVNTVLQGMNDGKIVFDDSSNPSYTPEQPIFPFFYRPSVNLRKILSSLANPTTEPTSFLEKLNLISIYSEIKLSDSLGIAGFGLVRGKNKFGPGYKKVKQVSPASKFSSKPSSSTIVGSNTIYLLSYDSQIPSNVERINLLKKDYYGISADRVSDEILPKTEPMVRGESLKELLELIVSFLVNHSHPYSQLPPYEQAKSEDATISKSDITAEFAQYSSKVLNTNIRINWYLSNKR